MPHGAAGLHGPAESLGDLEAELFDDLYAAEGQGQACPASYLTRSTASVPAARGPSEPVAAAPPKPALQAATPPLSGEGRLRELRRLSERKMAEQSRSIASNVCRRVDNSLACVFADAIREARRTNSFLPAASSSATLALVGGGAQPARLGDLERAFVAAFGPSGRGRNAPPGAPEVSAAEVDALVRDRLQGQRIDRLDSLLVVYDLQGSDPFDKLFVVREEFRAYLGVARVDEVQIHAFLGLMFCAAHDPIAPKLAVVRQVCPGIPHLHVMDQDPSLRFAVGRAAACIVQTLVMVHHHVPTAAEEEEEAGDGAGAGPGNTESAALERGLDDLVYVVRMLTGVVLGYFPELSTAKLESGAGAGQQSTSNPEQSWATFNEKASLVCRCAVEEAVAVPIFQGVLRPLFQASPFAASDRAIASQCAALAKGSPHDLLRALQVHDDYVLEHVPRPYMDVARLLGLVWDWDSCAGAGPTAKARLLVAACRAIPQCLASEGRTSAIGADDLLPIFIYAVVQSQPAALASLVHLMDRCVSPSLVSSEAGYALALLQTAVTTIPGLGAT